MGDRVAIATSAALCVVILALEAAGDSYNGIIDFSLGSPSARDCIGISASSR